MRFGTPDDYAEFFLPVILARFARTHPHVTVDVECVPSIQLMERTNRGEIDIAVVTFGCKAEADRRDPPGGTGVDHIGAAFGA